MFQKIERIQKEKEEIELLDLEKSSSSDEEGQIDVKEEEKAEDDIIMHDSSFIDSMADIARRTYSIGLE